MLQIKPNDKFTIKYDHAFPAYDGHCLRAFFYYGDQMPDIHMAEAGTRVFKVTLDNGTVEYLTEEELHVKYGDLNEEE